MDDKFREQVRQHYIRSTAPTCPFCGGAMLPLNYCADGHGSSTDKMSLFDQSGTLKACDHCGIVKFYPDPEERK